MKTRAAARDARAAATSNRCGRSLPLSAADGGQEVDLAVLADLLQNAQGVTSPSTATEMFPLSLNLSTSWSFIPGYSDSRLLMTSLTVEPDTTTVSRSPVSLRINDGMKTVAIRLLRLPLGGLVDCARIHRQPVHARAGGRVDGIRDRGGRRHDVGLSDSPDPNGWPGLATSTITVSIMGMSNATGIR